MVFPGESSMQEEEEDKEKEEDLCIEGSWSLKRLRLTESKEE